MKKLSKLFIAFCCIATTFVYSSCSWFVEGYNTDPNNPLDVPALLILPAVELSVGLNYSADLTWYSATWIQTQAGIDRQMLSACVNYNVISGDIDNTWIWVYLEGMMDAKKLIEKAEADDYDVSGVAGGDGKTDNPSYAGMAKVLMAMILQINTDCFGDVPYTDALKGEEGVSTPAFDSGQDIYNSINDLLDAAIADFARGEAGEDVIAPGSEDVIFGADLDKWIKAAYTLKARNAIHRSGPQGAAAYNEALTALNNGMMSNADDMEMPYGTSDPDEANAWYQFNTQRGDLAMGKFLVDMMVANNDPRLPFYALPDGNGDFTGSPVDVPVSSASRLGPFFGSINSPVPLMTYMEAMFIKAEALLATNAAAADIHAAFEGAVRASLDRTGVASADADTYFAAIDPGVGNVTLADIMNEKYVAMFTQIESWTDIRRTGIPALTPNVGRPEIPSRYPYPQQEIDLNPNVPASSPGLFDKLWWDVN